MTINKHIYGLIIVLFLLGSTIFSYRHWVLDVPLKETDTVNNWVVEANLKFYAKSNTPIIAKMSIPHALPNMAILDEYFISHHYGVNTNLEGLNRQVVWSLRRAKGQQSLYYRVILKQIQNDELQLPSPEQIKTDSLTEAQQEAASSMITQARESSADVLTFTQNMIKLLNDRQGNSKILYNPSQGEEALLKSLVSILNQAKILSLPLRIIHLKEQRHAEFQWMLAVYNGKNWNLLDPHSGSLGLMRDQLIWQYGFSNAFEVSGAYRPNLNLTISPAPMNSLSIAKLRGIQTDSDLLRFSLLQLPVDAQETYKVLLTVPIGAFIILILRNFVGLKTFGTFMPVLIALAFRETHVIWGLSLFTIIVALGLLVRFYLAQLHLLLVPRLSAILTVVILLMVAISIISQNLGLERGLSVALFPMVILTMTIERMCIVWDERGPSDALKSGFGSLLAATLAYFAMSQAAIQYLLFAFPELLLNLLAIILWFGQYRGYRLSELVRFKALVAGKKDA
jgi:hypothetical protein